MPSRNWFGKGCPYFGGVWEDTSEPDHKEYEPALNHCRHVANHSDTEGNCTAARCPIPREERKKLQYAAHYTNKEPNHA